MNAFRVWSPAEWKSHGESRILSLVEQFARGQNNVGRSVEYLRDWCHAHLSPKGFDEMVAAGRAAGLID